MRPKINAVYFHADFDGVVAAAILVRLSNVHPELHAVNYHMKSEWASMCLKKPAAVVDFLFHPDADIWFDHHSDPFLKSEWKTNFLKRQHEWMSWDVNGLSCPVVISEHVKMAKSIRAHFIDYNRWSAKIDSAAYSSPSEATDLENPYILLSKIISYKENISYLSKIVMMISKYGIEKIFDDPKISKLAQDIRKIDLEVRKELEHITSYDGMVVVFDQSQFDWPYQRYYPYLIHPNASFVIGIYKSEVSYTISVGSNPWKSQPEIDLAKLCSSLGGGGHKTVAGVVVPTSARAKETAKQIKKEILAFYS